MKNQLPADITQIVPHRPPILAIDRYRRIDDDTGVSQKKFSKEDYACTNGTVLESILIECVAQTVAAHLGYQSFADKDPTPVTGMLASVDAFEFHGPVRAGSTVEVNVKKTLQIGAFKIVEGRLLVKGEIVAVGTIKVFEPEPGDKLP